MKLLVTCESVRAVRDQKDKQIAEAVCFKAVHGLPQETQPDVVTLNITEDNPKKWGKWKTGELYSFVMTHHPKIATTDEGVVEK